MGLATAARTGFGSEVCVLASVVGAAVVDVGSAGAFLLGDGAGNVTGTTLYVDSGYHAMGM